MFSKKLLIPLLSLSLLVTPAYSSHAAENTEAAETSPWYVKALCQESSAPFCKAEGLQP